MIALLMFKTPLRRLIRMGLDRLKSVAVLFLSIYNMFKIQKREIEEGVVVNPINQVLMANHLLQATLMVMCIFLTFLFSFVHFFYEFLT
uniref:Uncharacterized protein n=1 Tax=Cajanus cajan TaxID=3821 RepID=A0A151TU53_CAJCA|nr:hypothetical protein KK1_009748 [Cajanus cajan]